MNEQPIEVRCNMSLEDGVEVCEEYLLRAIARGRAEELALPTDGFDHWTDLHLKASVHDESDR